MSRLKLSLNTRLFILKSNLIEKFLTKLYVKLFYETSFLKFDLQIDTLLKVGVKEKNIYKDISSGVKANRKSLDVLISKLREGDTIIVWKTNRIARSVSHMLRLVDDFKSKEVSFKSIWSHLLILLQSMVNLYLQCLARSLN
ncbi:recombinase family protein [Aquimarina sp. ERC-38]|uniref:recombinase family protein n=1 Tax=Aquimarina sp. ERC-38 TaxID=2949996 RepID=UPI003A598C87